VNALPSNEPALHVGDKGLEVVEAPESRMDPPEVDVSVLVHENVSEARQTLQPLRGLERDHAAREQAGRDLAVLVDCLLELAGQDVAARVEEGLGGDVEAVCYRLLEHQVLLEAIHGHREPRPEASNRFADLEELPANDFSADGHASLGPLTQERLLHPPEMCRIHVAGDGPRHEAHALVLVATHEAGPGRDDFVGQEGGRVVQDDQIDASTRGHLEIGHEPVQALGRRRAREEDRDVRVALRAGLAPH
jgi:hypothetical protein